MADLMKKSGLGIGCILTDLLPGYAVPELYLKASPYPVKTTKVKITLIHYRHLCGEAQPSGAGGISLNRIDAVLISNGNIVADPISFNVRPVLRDILIKCIRIV